MPTIKTKKPEKKVALTEKSFLSSGCYKRCYRISKKRVALWYIGEPDDTWQNALPPHKEATQLEKLKSYGIPTVKVYGIKKVDSSGISNQQYYGNGDDAIVEEYIVPGKYTKKTVADLRKILNIVKKNKLFITDFQFLVRKGGRVAVNDPGTVFKGQGGDGTYKETISRIEEAIEIAEDNMGHTKGTY